jgi:hypothetical protein
MIALDANESRVCHQLEVGAWLRKLEKRVNMRFTVPSFTCENLPIRVQLEGHSRKRAKSKR